MWELVLILFTIIALVSLYVKLKHQEQSLKQTQERKQEEIGRIIQQKEKAIKQSTKKLQQKEKAIKQSTKKLQQKEKEFQELEEKHLKTHARLMELKRARDVKKKNLKKYRKKKRKIRRETQTLESRVKEILGREDTWVDHSLSSPKSWKRGKPKGSNGGGRRRPERIHQEIHIYPQECENCGHDLKNADMFISHTSVFTDLFRESDTLECYETIRLKNVKKIVHRTRCPKCHMPCSPELGLFKNARFGPGFVSYVIGQRIETALPLEAIIGEMQKIFGPRFSLSAAAIVGWFRKFEAQIKRIYDQLADLLKESFFAHIDETGLSLQGENWWLWVICCANIVLYRESNTRGHDAIKDLIQGFEGTIIADFFSAYEKFDENEHQKCLAHLLSDIIEHIVRLKKQNDRIEKKLAEHEEAEERKKLKESGEWKKGPGRPRTLHALEDDELSDLKKKQEKNLQCLHQTMKLGEFFREPFTDGVFSYKQSSDDRIDKEDAEQLLSELISEIEGEGVGDDTIRKLLKRCKKYKGRLFTYLQQEGMPPDNNSAERRLRKFARQRKISGDFKSNVVLRNYAMYLSLFMTCEANTLDFDGLLCDILTGADVDIRHLLLREV